MFLALSELTARPLEQRELTAGLRTDGLGMSIGLGMLPRVAPRWMQHMPHALHTLHTLHTLLESGILLASLSAVALNLSFNGCKAAERAAIEGARTAEAH